MALPLTKQELADWILRRLGAPVVNIEVTDEQLEDCIDESVQFFHEYHYDGAERAYRTIKIDANVLNGNARRPHGLNAPTYDVMKDDTYRIGDRVMTIKSASNMPEKVWVKFDSEEKVYYRNFVVDAAGIYYVSDSDAPLRDDRYLYDSDWLPDSDGVYQIYNAAIHTHPGTRYTEVITSEPRALSFGDKWVPEDESLAAPFVDYDYSKEGLVGIPVPENIIGINKVLRIDNFSGMGMWNFEYQMMLNNFDMFYGSGGAGGAMTNYYTTKMNLEFIDHLMNVQPAIRFSKHRNKLYIDSNWTRFENAARTRDYYLMVECYEVNDPEIYGDVYKDKWLKRYATAITKMQWGSNLKKHNNLVLPGGVQIDGQSIYNEGKEEAKELEDELKSSLMLEMDFLIG